MRGSLFLLFAALQILCCESIASGQTQPTPSITSTPCPTPVSLKRVLPGYEARVSAQQRPATEPPSTVAESASTQERPLRIEFHGLTAFSYCDALHFLRSAPVLMTGMPNANAIQKGASILEENLKSLGYMRATVDAIRDDETQLVVFVVNEGVRFSVSDIRFEGNRAFSSEELSQNYSACLGQYQKDSGNGYNGVIHTFCERLLANLIRSRGYLEAKLESENRVSDSAIAIKLKIDEGAQYRLGQIKIQGNNVLSEELLRSKLEIRDGEVVDGNKLSKWLFELLKNLYAEQGFIEYTAEIIPTFNKQSGIVKLVVEIEEGQRFSLRSIEFKGYSKGVNPHDLFVLREGDFYNQLLFEESIKRLNDSGWFEFIKDRDVELLTNNEESSLKIVVNLRNRAN